MDPALYWELTPREGSFIAAGAMKRIRHEHNELMRAAWYAGSMQMFKKPPQLADLMVDSEPAPRVKPWQEIKAAIMFAMPPKTTVQ